MPDDSQDGGEYPSPLAELIVTTAKAKGVSLTHVAKRAGWSSISGLRYYYGGEWPRRPIPQAVQQQIADGLGISFYEVQAAVRASIGEASDADDFANLNTHQRVVLAALRKSDEETQKLVAEISLNVTAFAEKRQRRADLSLASDDDTTRNLPANP